MIGETSALRLQIVFAVQSLGLTCADDFLGVLSGFNWSEERAARILEGRGEVQTTQIRVVDVLAHL